MARRCSGTAVAALAGKVEGGIDGLNVGDQQGMAQQKSFPLKDTPLAGDADNPRFLRRGSMGFRFYGDFFDRYWNCHFVEHNRKSTPTRPEDDDSRVLMKSLERNVLSREELSLKSATKNRYSSRLGKPRELWLQRKLLELILFDEIVKEVTERTNELLQEIRNALWKTEPNQSPSNGSPEDNPFDPLILANIDSKSYFSFSRRWQQLEQLLQLLEDDLNETLSRIISWESREKDRGPERPRWTRKNESRYRGTLRKLLVSNNQRVVQLRRLQATVQSLRTSLTSKRGSIRDDLNPGGSVSVRYFTYVTVVFLPLGFASSVFSMNGIPAGAVVGSMSITALIALVITGALLYATSLYHNQKFADLYLLLAAKHHGLRQRTKGVFRASGGQNAQQQPHHPETNSDCDETADQVPNAPPEPSGQSFGSRRGRVGFARGN